MGRPYAEVIGDPIAHSKSPMIHRFWLEKLGIDADYRATHVREQELADYLTQRRRDADWRGCSVTMPHKIAALERIDSDEAGIGAVNCILPTNGALVGRNSDVDAILAALPDMLMPPESRVCLIGTGGAARAALAAMEARGVGNAMICARDLDAGRALLRRSGLAGIVRSIEDAHDIAAADLIINATPLGLAGGAPMPSTVLAQLEEAADDTVVFDMVYAPRETALLHAARVRGLRTVDGLAMLIGQAQAAFRWFYGSAPLPGDHAALRALL